MARKSFKREALTELLGYRLTAAQKQALETEAARLKCSSADVLRSALDLWFKLPARQRRIT